MNTAPKLAALPITKAQETALGENKAPFIEKQAETNNRPIDMPSLPVIQKEVTERNKRGNETANRGKSGRRKRTS